MFQLTVRGPDGSEKLYPIGVDQGLLVGRDEGSDIVLPSTRVSRRHARFYTTGAVLYLEDLGSQGGVFVGGARVQGSVEVRPGPPIEIGEFSIRIKREQSVSAGDYLGTLQGAGTMQGRTLTLPAERAIIGREAPAEIIIADDSVSRRHAEIRRLPDGSFVVRDLQSSNGTLVNNAKIPAEADRPLRPGDKVAFGDTQWVVGATHTGPSADVKRSRKQVLFLLLSVFVIVGGGIAAAFLSLGKHGVDTVSQHHEISPRDICLADMQNAQWDVASSDCQKAYDQDPINLQLRRSLRRAQREFKNNAIYENGVAKENIDDMQALDQLFLVNPESDVFGKAKIQIDQILQRDQPQLLAKCLDFGRKKGNEQAVDPCTRYLNYTCWTQDDNHDRVLKALKNVDTKLADTWVCPPALKPFISTVYTARPEDECPKKYPEKDLASACVAYAYNHQGEALHILSSVKDAREKAKASDLLNDMNQVFAEFQTGQTAINSSALGQAGPAFDQLLILDKKIMPDTIESFFATQARDELADAFLKQGQDSLGRNNPDGAYTRCAYAFKYRPNHEGLSACLTQAGKALAGQLNSTTSCDDLNRYLSYGAMPGSDVYAIADKLARAHCGQ